MKKAITKIVFWSYISLCCLFYEQLLIPFSLSHRVNISSARPILIFLCFTPVILFILLLILNFKRFFKFKYFLLVSGPLLISFPMIGEIQEHGLIYITPYFH